MSAVIDTTLGQLRVIGEIVEERKRQDEKWGEQNHPLFSADFIAGVLLFKATPAARASYYGVRSEERAKKICDSRAKRGVLSWPDIIGEELSEAVCAESVPAARAELVQLAAVVVGAIESIDRNHPRDGAA